MSGDDDTQGPVSVFPASYAQESLAVAETSAINVPAVARLSGPVDAARLGRLLDGLVARHAALRTVLIREPGGPVRQRVAASATLPVRRLEGQGSLPELLVRVLRAGAEQPFQLEGAGLARAELHSLHGDRHVLVVWLHHAISDLGSSQVLETEIHRLWCGEPLPPLVRQMGDVAARERATVPTPRQWRFWERTLADVDGRLGLPDPTRAEHLVLRPALPALGPEPVESLQRIAAASRTTMTAVLAAAVIAAHHAGAAADRVVIGLTINNRDHPHLRPVVGCLADQIPLVVDVRGRPTFRELLGRVREALLDAYDHRLPLGLLRPLLGRQDPPMFALNLNYVPPPARSGGNPPADELSLPYGIARTRPDPWWLGDASLAYRPRIDHRGLAGEIEGDGYLAAPAEVALFARRFSGLLARVARTPDRAIDTLIGEE